MVIPQCFHLSRRCVPALPGLAWHKHRRGGGYKQPQFRGTPLKDTERRRSEGDAHISVHIASAPSTIWWKRPLNYTRGSPSDREDRIIRKKLQLSRIFPRF